MLTINKQCRQETDEEKEQAITMAVTIPSRMKMSKNHVRRNCHNAKVTMADVEKSRSRCVREGEFLAM